jgi:phosphoribosyl-ATP pyrophosphohydrolase
MTDIAFLNELYAIILDRRKNAKPEESYVAKIASQGVPRMAQKVGEEAVETVIAAMKKDKAELKYESADLVFHLMMLWAENGITPDEIAEELYTRQCKVKK